MRRGLFCVRCERNILGCMTFCIPFIVRFAASLTMLCLRVASRDVTRVCVQLSLSGDTMLGWDSHFQFHAFMIQVWHRDQQVPTLRWYYSDVSILKTPVCLAHWPKHAGVCVLKYHCNSNVVCVMWWSRCSNWVGGMFGQMGWGDSGFEKSTQ